jgi:hypothetical protein
MSLRDRIRRLENLTQSSICVVIASQDAIDANPGRFRAYMENIEDDARRKGLEVVVLTDEVPLAVSPQGRLVYDFDPESANPKPGGIERLLHYTGWLRSGDDNYMAPD